MMQYSIVIPLKNEGPNIYPLVTEIDKAMAHISSDYEIVLVNDHSDDDTVEQIEQLDNARIKLVHQKELQHFKDEAVAEGYRQCSGDVVISLDGDMQNHPKDIPSLIENLPVNGMVCGVRATREDLYIRVVTSKWANAIRRFIVKDSMVDAGCAFRVCGKEHLALYLAHYKEFNETAHYFFPAMVDWKGCKVKYFSIDHFSRYGGETKFAAMKGRVISGLQGCMVARLVRKKIKSI
ncbi:MAG: glycosyltransferase [Desulfobacteraceae bacterium]|nr:glycosyltransferase [Desulfobacteraceae bacterium]